MFDPSLYHALTGEQADLVRKVAEYTKIYFENPKFDASHDFSHVLRVTAIAIKILEKEQKRALSDNGKPYDALTVVLGAILHDVDDRKYRTAGAVEVSQAQQELVRLGVEQSQAKRIQALIDNVSYSSEVKNPQRVRDLLVTIPELGIVQDADRLDAIGAVGLGRVFAYGAVKTSRGLSGSIDHLDEKLLKLESMMKTQTGRELAAEYTARLEQFKSWWKDEVEFAGTLP
ncbi:hypothetical protein H2198_001968 [Neophaeococcomyces mojaviensis]|uniref:Uncharacterized protein n=1 Tax=Neophaeococcomyces mojaviensis TaxID=3383035 RepID=A0ACC3AFF8_9EURO|nr:hypothetical protein H2198_001968 [Knufia sp. JES_112]